MATVLDAMKNLDWQAKYFTPKGDPQDEINYDEADITHWFQGEWTGRSRYEHADYDEQVFIKLVRWPKKVQLVVEFHKLVGEGQDVSTLVQEIKSHRMDKYAHHMFFDNPPVIEKALHDVYIYVNEQTAYSLSCVYESSGWDHVCDLGKPILPKLKRQSQHHRDWDDYEGEGWFFTEPPY